MKKEQRLMTLTLLRLVKTFSDNTEILVLSWQSKIFDGFVAAICSMHGLHYEDPVSYRICTIIAGFTSGQYRIMECFKQIESELKAFERLPG